MYIKPLISIIVPVYNVEEFLEKCIDSILNQTFKNFELILINDGSTDNSGNICEKYSKKDDRIIVIHKKNGGVSSARNVGLDLAQGEYIGFVDSDDFIEEDMYELLYTLITETKKDIANVGINFIYENIKVESSKYDKKIFNKYEAMENLLKYKFYGDYIWTNLFKADLIKKFKFKNVYYEDIDLMYQLIDKSNGIVTIGKQKYNYLQRENSITKSKKLKLLEDKFLVCSKRGEFLKSYYPIIYQKIEKNFRKNLIDIFFVYLKIKLLNNKKIQKCQVLKTLNKYFYDNIKTKEISLSIKIQLILLKFFSNLYIKLFKIKVMKGLKCKKY